MSSCQINGETSAARYISLNQSCVCLPIDRANVDRNIASENPIPGIAELLNARSHLFAGTSVFVSNDDLSAMYQQIEALDAATKSTAFQGARLSSDKVDLYQAQPCTLGVMMGYDFHITPDGPKLIEINTNAGGAFLVAALQSSLGGSRTAVQKHLVATFISEWRRTRRTAMPRTLAIIDEQPSEQYLYPDMLLAQQWLEIAGIDTIIADPSELRLQNGFLMLGPRNIDMVYNRTTDFSLSDARFRVLRDALLTDAAIVSPAPRHHALHANKQNLAYLTNTNNQSALGLSADQEAALSALPKTEIVAHENADALWARRKHLFFKPASGFASRATYRGSKITRRVWEDLLQGEYVAQEFIKPTYRAVDLGGDTAQLKYDVRVYTFDGEPLLLAARVYQGQTTNFRSPGGGFAPVITSHVSPY